MRKPKRVFHGDGKGAYGTDSQSPLHLYFTLMEAGALDGLDLTRRGGLISELELSRVSLESEWSDPDTVTRFRVLYGLVSFQEFPGKEEILTKLRGVLANPSLAKTN
jgi:hypothetical protein